jgi:hypothetical protein
LVSLVELRSEFSAIAEREADGSTRYLIKPAISTFSDHIVISYSLDVLREAAKTEDPTTVSFLIYPQFTHLISAIALRALRLGFLIRGAATIGRLYHANGVVFGEALVEVTQLEARTAVYPRIVLSSATTTRLHKSGLFVKRDADGIYYIDYIAHMLFGAAPQGDDWAKGVKRWFDDVVLVVKTALEEHERSGRLNELAKWTWFASHFRDAILAMPPEVVQTVGISAKDIPELSQ